MSSTIPNSDAFNWVIGPATQCVSLIAEESRIASVLQRAIVALSHQGPLLQFVRQRLTATTADVQAIDRLILEQQGGLGQWASELMSEDFEPINKHGVIGMWVALEVAVEDTVVLVLMNDGSARQSLSNAGVKLPQSLSLPLTEADARRVYRRLEAYSRKDRSVASGYSHLLSILGISVTLSPDVISSLAELNYLRNCLLHRAGFADERSTVEAPGLSLDPGTQIKISSERYRHYFDSAGKFAQALLAGVLSSSYVRTKPQAAG